MTKAQFKSGLFAFMKYLPFGKAILKALYLRSFPSLQKNVLGLRFSNPIGVGSGLDKTGSFYDEIAAIGPSFVEIGPLRDVHTAIATLQEEPKDCVVFADLSNSGNIERGFSLIYDFVDAVVFNASSNTNVLATMDRIITLRRYNDVYKPIIIKLFPDLKDEQYKEAADYILRNGIDAVEVIPSKVSLMLELTHNLVPVISYGRFSNYEEVAKTLADGAQLVALSYLPVKDGFHYVNRLLQKLSRK